MLKRFILALLVSLAFGTVAAAADAPAQAKNPVVLMETTLGNIKIELFQKEAPVSVKNFLDYVNSGFYAGTIFHRVIPNFMAQGGGYTDALKKKPGNPPIKNEATNGLKNDRGTLAMARTSVINSASSEFFINVVNNDFLNHQDESQRGYGYAVFGKVIEGMDVVDKIVASPQQAVNMLFQNLPTKTVVIKSVSVVK
ncbi:peptidylprolyl isomerase [Geobacter argillaceus]|uniref:Peptidyl-prolyl cis-trans isomerase n=1 Tax=Geobacter argillaceus TaxID=345631 RepID=A0A562VM67_9BACT|nr:peptidylprolyl isomerase [Geobacter argillaceus]TWJ18990.1 peptidyl-prolyl cis-trans isomerase A (cyclophilin A) [Geobacter argillaceus]